MNKNIFKQISGSIYFVLIARLAMVMLLFSICRVAFYLFNTDLFPDMTFGYFMKLMNGGWHFDLTAVLYTNSVYLIAFLLPFRFRYHRIFQNIFKWIFYVTNSVALAANCADFIYYRFTSRRTTWSVFSEFANDKGNTALMGRFLIDYWPVLLFWIAMVALLVFIYKLVKLREPIIKKSWVFYVVHTLLVPICIYLAVGGIRGNFRHSTRPITISNAAQYVDKPMDIGIVLNTPFSIYRTLKRNQYKKLDYFKSQAELENIYTPVHFPADSGKFTPKNVVIIILESFATEHIGSLNKNSHIKDYCGYTPFFDSIVSQSLTFEHSFANGRKSIDAMPSVIASIPSFVDPYVLSIYANNPVKALPNLLKEKGYYSAFFHGAPNGSMGFQAFAAMAGYDNYYGMNEYNNNKDFDGWWGIFDEPFFQYFANTLNQKPEPFLGTIFSLSSHHPFTLPKEYEGKFPLGKLEVHKCIGYTDNALRNFFATAEKMPWFKNTIFVFVADHTNQTFYEEYSSSVGLFKIPIVIYDPHNPELKGIHIEHSVIQQIDIMPTILGYLHYDKPYFGFGFNALDTNNNKHFAINYLNGTYQIYEGDYVLHTNENGPIALFKYDDDPLLKNNLKDQQPEMVERLNNKFKAFLQTYNERLIDNKMVY